jgi:hypothetical protein
LILKCISMKKKFFSLLGGFRTLCSSMCLTLK